MLATRLLATDAQAIAAVSPWRVVNEILFVQMTSRGLLWRREIQDLSRRSDVVGGEISISDAVRERVERRAGAQPGAPMLVHSTGWRRAPDGTIVLPWVVDAAGLDLAAEPGTRLISRDRLAQGAPPGDPAIEARVIRAAGHVAFLAGRDPAVRAALGARGELFAWLQVPPVVAAGDETRSGHPAGRLGPGRSRWRVVLDELVVDLPCGGQARALALQRELTGRADLAAGRGSLGALVRADVDAAVPGAGADPATALASTSWRQADDGSLHLHWTVLARQLPRAQAAAAFSLRPSAGIAVSADAAAPDSVSHDLRGVAVHGLETLALSDDPALRSALAQLPARQERLLAWDGARREVTAPRIDEPGRQIA